MGISPSHRFGQIIGEALEVAVRPLLADFAAKHGLYLDRQGPRSCRKGTACSWTDRYGNSHDLDFVLERGGTTERMGVPVAFIETAWRRYTKHSRNKAQEIQGAILPLAETWRDASPFKGAILAGVFTEGALAQLRSLGFTVLYFPHGTIVDVFRSFGVDAAFDEATPDAQFKRKASAYAKLTPRKRTDLADALLRANADGVRHFLTALEASVSRRVQRVAVLPLHGSRAEWATVRDAIRFVEDYSEAWSGRGVVGYEIQVRFNNGDVIEGRFETKSTALEFLRVYEPFATGRP